VVVVVVLVVVEVVVVVVVVLVVVEVVVVVVVEVVVVVDVVVEVVVVVVVEVVVVVDVVVVVVVDVVVVVVVNPHVSDAFSHAYCKVFPQATLSHVPSFLIFMQSWFAFVLGLLVYQLSYDKLVESYQTQSVWLSLSLPLSQVSAPPAKPNTASCSSCDSIDARFDPYPSQAV